MINPQFGASICVWLIWNICIWLITINPPFWYKIGIWVHFKATRSYRPRKNTLSESLSWMFHGFCWNTIRHWAKARAGWLKSQFYINELHQITPSQNRKPPPSIWCFQTPRAFCGYFEHSARQQQRCVLDEGMVSRCADRLKILLRTSQVAVVWIYAGGGGGQNFEIFQRLCILRPVHFFHFFQHRFFAFFCTLNVLEMTIPSYFFKSVTILLFLSFPPRFCTLFAHFFCIFFFQSWACPDLWWLWGLFEFCGFAVCPHRVFWGDEKTFDHFLFP